MSRLSLLLLLYVGLPSISAEHKKERLKSAAPVEFSHERGFYSAPFQVTLSTRTAGAKIFFTTNGAAPTESAGELYERPIAINATTILRAAAFKENLAFSPVETQTYIFARDVLKQTGAGFPKTWGTNDGQPVPADYAMDPDIVNDPAYRDGLEAALKSIPTLSIVMELKDLYDPSQGIYANPKNSGAEWERPASVELIYPDGRRGFQVNCGIRIQGGWNRRPEECPKHSFRLLFKKKYGAASLKFPLFGDTGVREFETIILRGGCNNTWLHWSGEERRRADFVRDQWMRDTVRTMGHLSARGFFAHLYLNGLYWGLYNPCERPSAPFVAAHLGGTAKDYDSRNGVQILEGDKTAWNQMLALANAGLSGDREFQAMQELLDVPGFIDYMIANFYGANADWDRASNWYAARRRNPPGKFQFFVWDGERTLEAVDANSMEFDDDESPPRLFHKLRANAEFRLQFGDRVQRHLFNGGALTPEISAARFRAWSDQIDGAVAAESARWGDYRRDVHPYKTGPYELYTRDDHWRPEIKRLFAQYFPRRTAVVLKQFREAGLYPKTDAPSFRTSGGEIILSAPAGVIFFTKDGSDPRLPGGKVSPTATKYQAPIPQSAAEKFKARALLVSSQSEEWSALVEF